VTFEDKTRRKRTPKANNEDKTPMLYALAVILLVLWLLGFVAFHVGGGLIHLLLVIAVIVVIYQLVTSRRAS
jgi:Flp pilus assembly protein TadB